MTMPPRPERLRRVTLAGYPQDGDKLVRWFLDGLDAYLLLGNGGAREVIISLGLLMRSNGLSIPFHGEPCSDPSSVKDRSNCANAPKTWDRNSPCGMVVAIRSVNEEPDSWLLY
jgi:hypothetical protein